MKKYNLTPNNRITNEYNYKQKSKIDAIRQKVNKIIPQMNLISQQNEKLISNSIGQAKNLKNINALVLNTTDLHSYQRSVIQNCNVIKNIINQKLNQN